MKRLEDRLHAAEQNGLDELRDFERNVLRKERDKATHQWEGLSNHRQEEVSILPSGFNVHYEQALAAAKNELDEIAKMDEEAKQKVDCCGNSYDDAKNEARRKFFARRPSPKHIEL